MYVELTIKGTRPLLIQSDRLVDPLDEIKKKIKRLTDKRTNKTENDILEIYELEWKGSLYYDKEIGPYIPGENLLASIRDGGKKTRHGKKVLQAVLVQTDVIPLVYDGPRELDALWKHHVQHEDGITHPFRYSKSVKIGKARTMRMRPKFEHWALKAVIILTPKIMDLSTFKEVLTTAGEQEGLGTYRPRYGRYEVVSVKEIKEEKN